MGDEHATAYDDESWLGLAERLFEIIAVPQPGHTKLYVCRNFLQTVPEEFYERHPREWQTIALAALQDGASYDLLAQDAGVGVKEIKRRLGRR